MKIKSSLELPDQKDVLAYLHHQKDVFVGPKHQNFANRYKLRTDGNVEVQHIYRYGKPSATKIMTPVQFVKFVNQ